MDVTDKIAVVTGGGRGIGRGIALALANNGAHVVIAEIIEKNGRETAKLIEDLGRRAMTLTVDVTDQSSVDRLMPDILEQFDRVDILINNAGVIGASGWDKRERVTEEDWDLTFEVNVKGVARVTDAIAPHMKERKYGKIVNIASVAARQGSPFNPSYNASKAAVVNLTQAQSLELAPYDLNVNAICPGQVVTPMNTRFFNRLVMTVEVSKGMSVKEAIENYNRETVPLGRGNTPEDIGNVATFLASDAARGITGQAINVDGGIRMN